MADRLSLAGGATDWSVAGIWTNIDAGGNNVPVSTDLAIVTAGTQTINAGLGQTGDDLGGIWVARAFSGTIGASGNRLTLAADLVTHLGTGAFWLAAEDNGTGLKIDRILLDSDGGSMDVSGDAAALTLVQVIRGTMTCTLAPVTLEVGYRSNRSNDATVIVPASAGTITTLEMWGGTLSTNDAFTTADFHGGRWTHEEGAITNLNALSPGTVVLNGNDTVTTARVGNGAVLDLMANNNVKAITTLYIYPGGEVLYDDSTTDADATTPLPLHNVGTVIDLRKLAR